MSDDEKSPLASSRPGVQAGSGGSVLTVSVSVKLTPLPAAPFGLLMVNVRTDTPLTIVGSGMKPLAIVRDVGSMMLAMRLEVEKSEL